MPLPNGATFAGYTILRLLGSGETGEVYLAQHPRLPRQDALKVLPLDVSADPEYRARFAREADLAAKLPLQRGRRAEAARALVRLRAWDGWQIISDVLQITLNALQITLNALQIRDSILECLLHLVRAWFVLRAVRDDGTSDEVGALIGVPYRRSLHEADGLCEVGLVR